MQIQAIYRNSLVCFLLVGMFIPPGIVWSMLAKTFCEGEAPVQFFEEIESLNSTKHRPSRRTVEIVRFTATATTLETRPRFRGLNKIVSPQPAGDFSPPTGHRWANGLLAPLLI